MSDPLLRYRQGLTPVLKRQCEGHPRCQATAHWVIEDRNFGHGPDRVMVMSKRNNKVRAEVGTGMNASARLFTILDGSRPQFHSTQGAAQVAVPCLPGLTNAKRMCRKRSANTHGG